MRIQRQLQVDRPAMIVVIAVEERPRIEFSVGSQGDLDRVGAWITSRPEIQDACMAVYAASLGCTVDQLLDQLAAEREDGNG